MTKVKEAFSRLLGKNTSFALAAGSGVIGPAISLLVAPVLTRLYTPAEFGILATFAAVLAAGMSIVNLRYDVAIPIPEKDEEACSLTLAIIRISIFTAVAISAIFWIITPYVFEHAMEASITPYIWWLPIALFIGGAAQTLTQFAIRRGAFGEIARARLAQGIAGPATQITAGLWNAGVAGLLVGQLASLSGGFLRLWKNFSSFRKTLGILPPMMDLLKRFERFPKISLLPAFVNAFGLQLPLLIVGRTHGAEAAGIIALIFRVMGTPISILSSASVQMIYSEGARGRRNGENPLPLIYTNLRRQLFLISPALAITPFLPWLVPRIFGAEWAASGQYALILVPTLVVIGILGPTFAFFDIYERQDIQFMREAIRVVTLILAVEAAQWMGSTMWAIVGCLSAVLIGNCLFGYFLLVRLAKKESRKVTDLRPTE